MSDKFAKIKHDLSVKGLTNSGAMQSDQLAALAAQEVTARAALPAAGNPPSEFGTGAAGKKAWGVARTADVTSLTEEFTARKLALHDSFAKQKLKAKIKNSDAAFALGQSEKADKLSLTDQFARRRIGYANTVTGDNAVVRDDNTYLRGWLTKMTAQLTAEQTDQGSINASGGIEDQLTAYGWSFSNNAPTKDPAGALMLNILTDHNINIPNLHDEAASLTGTKIPVANNTLAQQQQMDAYLLAQNTQLALTNAVLNAQYKVLGGLGTEFPEFAGVFHRGGRVPGPIGAERLVLAQGGEVIQPIGASTSVSVHNNYANGMEWLGKFVESKVKTHDTHTARTAARSLPGAGGGSFFS
jgi:hypothetical protein